MYENFRRLRRRFLGCASSNGQSGSRFPRPSCTDSHRRVFPGELAKQSQLPVARPNTTLEFPRHSWRSVTLTQRARPTRLRPALICQLPFAGRHFPIGECQIRHIQGFQRCCGSPGRAERRSPFGWLRSSLNRSGGPLREAGLRQSELPRRPEPSPFLCWSSASS